MKYIIFLRHGKAEKYAFDKVDYVRNLSSRGINNCELISDVLKKSKIIPDIIITSPANRTLQTAQIFAENLDYDPTQIVSRQSLYDYVGVGNIQDLLAEQDNSHSSLMIVGHNPWITNMASNFSKEFYREMPTTGLVVLAFDVDHWKEIEPKSGKLEFFEYPKKYE